MHAIARVLVAGRDEPSLNAVHLLLESAGHAVSRTSCAEDAARRVSAGEADVVLLADDALPSLDRLVHAHGSHVPMSFVALSSTLSASQARAALRAGVSDVVDPASAEPTLLAAVERAAREGQLRRELAILRARVSDAAQLALIGRSLGDRPRAGARRAGPRRRARPCWSRERRGTGKDVVARLVHDLSERAARPIVTVRCADADADALERELFGRAGRRRRAGPRGPARGGARRHRGARRRARRFPPRCARSSRVRARLARRAASAGRSRSPVDVRLVLIARESGAESDAASIEDLLVRFNAIVVDVPPLRERRSDIPQLVQHFRQRLAEEHGLDLRPLSPEEMLSLPGQEWTGNVRELEHWVERHALASANRAARARRRARLAGVDLGSSRATLEQLERAYIMHVLALESGHQSRAAVRLGIDRRTLYRKLKQYRSA